MEQAQAMTVWWNLATWPEWQQYLLTGILMAVQLVAGAIVIGRTGRTPYWALLAIMPLFFAPTIGLWALAFCRWPKIDR